MAKRTAWVHVRILRSFNGLRKGDEATLELNAKVQGWIGAGLAEVVDGGKDPAGPGGAEPDPGAGEQGGAAGGVASGGEPGQGFGTGAFGAAEGFDQG